MTIDTRKILEHEASELLEHSCRTVPVSMISKPGPNWVEEMMGPSDRPVPVLRNLAMLFSTGRLANTGYVSILPVDHGVEHSAGSAFGKNPRYFDPENIVRLALEGGCSGVASTVGILGAIARRYAHKIPFIVKVNHNELLSYPNSYDQRIFATVKQAFELGAVGVGATVYFGSPESRRQIEEVSRIFEHAHRVGMFCVLWCYLRNSQLKERDPGLQAAADLAGQANYLGTTIQSDIIKQKIPVALQGFRELHYGKSTNAMYDSLLSDNVIDLTRYQVINCFSGRSGLINSGGPSNGENDFVSVVKNAVINKRAGGIGLITGRKAFQRPFEEGVDLLHAVQDVYLDNTITLA